jgi:hypothetical protein
MESYFAIYYNQSIARLDPPIPIPIPTLEDEHALVF